MLQGPYYAITYCIASNCPGDIDTKRLGHSDKPRRFVRRDGVGAVGPVGVGGGVDPYQLLLEGKVLLPNVKHLTLTPPPPHNHAMREIILFENPQIKFDRLAATGLVYGEQFDLYGKTLHINTPGILVAECTFTRGSVMVTTNSVVMCKCVFHT